MKKMVVGFGKAKDTLANRGKAVADGALDVGGKAAAAAITKAKEAAIVAKDAGGKAVGIAKEVGGKAAVVALDKSKELVAREQERHQQRLIGKYGPVFPDEYLDPSFDLPKLIVIKDEDARKGIEVCDGAIGWIDRSSVPEVFYLYENAVRNSGLSFYPKAVCGAAYYTDDPVGNSNRYVDIACYLEEFHESCMDELGRIAFDLGAKECQVELIVSSKDTFEVEGDLVRRLNAANGPKANIKEEDSVHAGAGMLHEADLNVVYSRVFSGSDIPCRPELHWFESEKGILSLIDMRCSGRTGNKIETQEINIKSNSSSVMSADLAGSIDGILKASKITVDFGGNASFKAKATKESQKRFRYKIVF